MGEETDRPAEHSPLPWHLTGGGIDPAPGWHGWVSIRDADDNEALMESRTTDEFILADMRFIVAACNAHERLVEALREIAAGDTGQSGLLAFQVLRELDDA